jgi:hypothetical protein
LSLYTIICRSSSSAWKDLLFRDSHFHEGLLQIEFVEEEEEDMIKIILELLNKGYFYLIAQVTKEEDDEKKNMSIKLLERYVNKMFYYLNYEEQFKSRKIFSSIISLLSSMLSSFTARFYLSKENLHMFSLTIGDQLRRGAFIDMMIKVLQLIEPMFSSSSQLTDDENTLEKAAIFGNDSFGGLITSLLDISKTDLKCNDESYPENGMILSSKAFSLLSLLFSIDSSFHFFFNEEVIKPQLKEILITTLICIKRCSSSEMLSCFLFTNYLVDAWKVIFLLCSNSSNQQYMSLDTIREIVEHKMMTHTNEFLFSCLSSCYNNERIIEQTLLVSSLFNDEMVFKNEKNCSDVASNDDDDEMEEVLKIEIEFLFFLVSFHINNDLIVEYGLLLIQRWFHCHKDSLSSSYEDLLKVIKKIMKSRKMENHHLSKTILETLLSLITTLKEVDLMKVGIDKDMKLFFSAKEMKESGMTISELKEMGYSIHEMKESGFLASELKDEGGYSVKELYDGGYLLSDLKTLYSLEELLIAGVIPLAEAKKAGKTASEMKDYYSLIEIRDEYGLSVKELWNLGYRNSDFLTVDMQYRTMMKGFDSSVIINLPFFLDLLSLLPSNLSLSSLLYRSSRDGCDRGTYHSKCDNQGPHLTIMKCSEGYIFGGYMGVTMTTDGGWMTDFTNTSFLFTLKNPKGEVAKKYPINPEKNIYAFYSHTTEYSVYFGSGPTIRSDDMKIVSCRSSPTYEDYGEGNLCFTGKEYNTITEVEVWKISM